MKISVKDLTRVLKGQLILGDPKNLAIGACVDSRIVQPGFVFFAFKGEHSDGHEFAMSACRQGAAAVVVSHLTWLKGEMGLNTAVIRVQDPQESLRWLGQILRTGFKGPVVGITGSNGKTTTKQMVSSILKKKGPGLSTTGNFNSQIGLPLVLSFLKPEDQWMVLEMGASAPGHIAALADVAHPTLGIITSIGPAHIATFGSLKKIAESKWELMDALPTDGTAIVPWAEPALEPHVRSFKKKIVFFGEDTSCPVRASSVQTGEKIRFLLHIGSQSAPVTLPLAGRYNVGNALAAAAAGWVLGYSIEEIASGLESFEPPKMRMEVVPHPSGAILINDAYNANPASMSQSARSLTETYPDRKRVLVLGSMLELGTESEKFHFHIGADLSHYALERIYLIGNETKQILEGAVSAGCPASRFSMANSMDDLIRNLKPHLRPDTVLLFKGSRGIHLEKAIEGLIKS